VVCALGGSLLSSLVLICSLSLLVLSFPTYAVIAFLLWRSRAGCRRGEPKAFTLATSLGVSKFAQDSAYLLGSFMSNRDRRKLREIVGKLQVIREELQELEQSEEAA
jgi:hypothetical protein